MVLGLGKVEGGLFLVPFAALQDSDGNYLSETYRIRLIPSLTSLQVIQSFPENYHSQTGALIVADPTVGLVEFDGKIGVLSPLPGSRMEADMVSRYVPAPYFKLIGEQATKNEVIKRIQDVGLVHIAAHGDAERGEIALAPNERTAEIVQKKDFMLTMEDIAKVGIKAKLVVLSCCNSGRDKDHVCRGSCRNSSGVSWIWCSLRFDVTMACERCSYKGLHERVLQEFNARTKECK